MRKTFIVNMMEMQNFIFENFLILNMSMLLVLVILIMITDKCLMYSKSWRRLTNTLALITSLLPFHMFLEFVALSLKNFKICQVWLLFPQIPDQYLQFWSQILILISKFFSFGSINFLFSGLTSFTCFLLVLWVWNTKNNNTDVLICILITEFALINVFHTNNILWFFITFEMSALPLIYMIGKHGPTFRKIKALYYFVAYTIFGSAFLLFAILLLVLKTNSFFITDYLNWEFSQNEAFIIWCFLFIGFGVKVPIMPIHLWLLEAHVEAPTVGSVILAALLLKVGGYGIYQFCCKIFYETSSRLAPYVIAIAIVSMAYAIFNAFMQLDIKRSIAYSSIAHMNASLIALFCLNNNGSKGFIVSMISHGFTSAGLFFLAGILYKNYHTKNISYYGGLIQVAPIFSIFFMFFCFSNGAFPGTLNFIGELFLLLGIIQKSIFVAILFVIFSSVLFIYFVWFAVQINCGELDKQSFEELRDLNKREILILLILTISIIYLGCCPSTILELVELDIQLT